MTWEPPEDPREARRVRLWRWVSTLLALALVAFVAYVGYVGYEGSRVMVEAPRSANCQTPESAFGWSYEAINYPQSADSDLAAYPDRLACPSAGPMAGTELTTSDGIQLAGWYVPAGDGAPATGATLVLVHGFGGNKSEMLDVAELLHPRFNLVLFDLRNHGQSSGDATTQGVREQRDLRAVLDWLETTKEPSNIGVVGSSMGGVVAVNVVASDLRADAVVIDATHATLASAAMARLDATGLPLSLVGSWSILLGGLLRTGEDMSTVDSLQAVARLDVPLMIINDSNDTTIGRTDAADMLAAAEAAGVEVEAATCESAGHDQTAEVCPDTYRQDVRDFFLRVFASS